MQTDETGEAMTAPMSDAGDDAPGGAKWNEKAVYDEYGDRIAVWGSRYLKGRVMLEAVAEEAANPLLFSFTFDQARRLRRLLADAMAEAKQ